MISKLTGKSWNLEINGYGSLQETYFFIEERREILSRERGSKQAILLIFGYS